MAADKRKILENARKYAQKGAKDKALKEYNQLVKLDPKDSKLRLEIGDAYRRWGQIQEAIDTYQKVADQYMREGFDARAVAVYKQILNLDPDRHSAHEPLAELYERMGLTSEAINALQTAADGYHKQGKKREALELLRKMATIDPSNTTSRIKVAELLRQEKLNDEAAAEYEQVAAELERQSDFDAAANVYRKLLELKPQHAVALAAFGRNLLRQNKGAEAESIAKRAIAANAEEPAHYELLADAYRAQKREDLLAQAYQPLADLYQRRGDGERAREIIQRYLPMQEFTADNTTANRGAFLNDGSGSDHEEHPENARGLEATPDSPFDTSGLDGLDSDLGGDLGEDIELDDALADSAAEIVLTRVADGSEAAEDDSAPVIEAPEGDPDQLLAEASVYLRYGKSDKAIAHLRAIIDRDPNHRVALEKLGEAHAERGDDGKAVDLWTRAAKVARKEGAHEAASLLRGRIEALDPKAAAALGDGPAPKAKAPKLEVKPAPPPRITQVELRTRVAVDPTPVEVKPPKPEPKPAKPAAKSARAADTDPNLDLEIGEEELDLDVDLDEIGEPEEERPEPVRAAKPAARKGEPELESEEGTEEGSVELADAANDTGIEGASLSTATTQQILEDLEEADFYMEQGLLDEAEGLFKRVLAIAPNHPRALVRLGELAAARGADPSGAARPAAAKPVAAKPAARPAEKPAPAPPAAKAKPKPAEVEVEIEEPAALGDISIDEGLDAGTEAAPSPAAAVADEEIAAAFSLDSTEDMPVQDAGGDTPVAAEQIAQPAPAPAPVAPPAPRPAPIAAAKSAPAPGVKPAPAAPPAPAPIATAHESGDFDLAAELSDAFDDPNERSTSGENVDFETVFAAFKRGVSETLDDGDYEAHYDLGIAYKEMGLFDDAIAEFHIAMGNANRETECVHLIALCGIDSGRPEMAIDQLERLLRKPNLVKDQALVVRFDLGRAYAAQGQSDAARAAFQAVVAIDPKFQDAAQRLAELEGPKPKGKAAEASGGFESFDDMLSEMSDEDEEEEKPEAEASAGESFADVTSDAEADEAPAAEPEPEPEPVPAKPAARSAPPKPAAKPAPAAPPSSGKRKKKISFL